MGLILPQVVNTKTSSKTNKYYEDLGYKIPHHINKNGKCVPVEGETFEVHVLDLMKNSNIKVKVQCDICGKIFDISYGVYNKYLYNGEYSCNNCNNKSKKSKDKTTEYYLIKRNLLIDELTSYINKNGYPTSIRKVFHSKNEMHCVRSYINCFGGDLTTWIEACGFVLTDEEKEDILKRGRASNISKDDATKIVYSMINKLNRPLMYDDFRNPSENNSYLSITVINKIWGSLNKMKADLGLEIIQENMNDRKINIDEALLQINKICNYIYTRDKRKFITSRDFDEIKNIEGFENISNYGTLHKMLKNNMNISMSEYISSIGFTMGKQGNGILYDFEDGEHTTSQFEYMFSNYLRDYGFKYNIDYFRNVRYKEFISDYTGMMDCDYKINIGNKTIYIEIAGIIADYKLWYYGDKPITTSKSKEKYRFKLKEKEKMFKENNLIYFILFPCDLTRDIFMQIINDGSLEIKHAIEKFMKNNIEWTKIQAIGELKYKENETSCYGQLVVDYDFKEVS
jgi:hypothetical protein